LVVDCAKIPIDPLTERICQALDLDPLRLISSGSLILASSQPDDLIQELARKGVLCTAIGRLTAEPDRVMLTGDGPRELEPPGSDELYKTL